MGEQPESGGFYDPGMFSPKDRFDPIGESDLADALARYGNCRLCGQGWAAGNRPTLMTVGPMDVDNARKAVSGRAYTAEAIVVHQDCVYGEDLTWE